MISDHSIESHWQEVTLLSLGFDLGRVDESVDSVVLNDIILQQNFQYSAIYQVSFRDSIFLLKRYISNSENSNKSSHEHLFIYFIYTNRDGQSFVMIFCDNLVLAF